MAASSSHIRRLEQFSHVLFGFVGQVEDESGMVHGRSVLHALVLDHNPWYGLNARGDVGLRAVDANGADVQ